eukprot:gene9618-7489_t
MYDLDREGARDILLAAAALNTCPEDAWESPWRAIHRGLRHMGQCGRTTVPQDGFWYRSGGCENSLAGDLLNACARVDATISWDCGRCTQRGPLLVQRGLQGGKGLTPRSVQPGECTVFRPDPARAWLELWNAGGQTIPVIPVPAEFADFLRSQPFPLTTPTPSGAEATHHLGPLYSNGITPGSKVLERMAKPGSGGFQQYIPPADWVPRPGEQHLPRPWEPKAAQHFRWCMGGLCDTSGDLLPQVKTWLPWKDCD